MKKKIIVGLTGLAGLALTATVVFAVTGDLLDTVGLPGNGGCSVAGTFTGTYYMTVDCVASTLQIYTPPAPVAPPGLPADPATALPTKSIVDAGGAPVSMSALAWDPSRKKLWGAYDDKVYLIDIGDPTAGGSALATFKFSPSANAPGEVGPLGLPGISLVDGLAYDVNNDSVWYSPDVHCHVYNFKSDGTYLGKVSPENAVGAVDCSVSGVVVGSANTLYIGRNGFSEIRRVDKTTGDFVSTFATTAGRVEDLTCDPITYAPIEAILAKDAHKALYEAFEVEEGTCPLPLELACTETVNPHGKTVPPAGSTTLPGPRGGQNEDGFYELGIVGLKFPKGTTLWVTDASSSGPFGPYNPGDNVKITEAPGGTPSSKKIGSTNGKAGAVVAHITLTGDPIIVALDPAGNALGRTSCLVPPPPK